MTAETPHHRALKVDRETLLLPISISHRLRPIAPTKLWRQIKGGFGLPARLGLGQRAFRSRRKIGAGGVLGFV